MTAVRARPAVPIVAALVACGALASCSSDAEPRLAYTSSRVAPLPSELERGYTETTPDAENALRRVPLESGSVALLWIGPDDIAEVHVQYSDPDDPTAWTEPVLLHRAGDGCLTMNAATAGGTLAVGLGCYVSDAFLQQAPDHGVALVTADLQTWDEADVGESIPVPEVSADGETVEFRDGIFLAGVEARWRSGEGFE